ncbi:OprD family porin [Azotobacter chroococcum]|uniref:OprD family porin n=1 Tax=Azotobacter chroococcum TaxID=353 RepID=A0AA43Z3U0_9GAMM|nr:OprD family porin [Azotobacter chroococcum]NHN76241.1 OprD family porin [Azotobacter chroococcum]
MHKYPFQHIKGLNLLTLCGCLLPLAAQGGFVEDSHLSLELRNFYMNRDYRDAGLPDTPRHKGQSKAKAEDWGQGFMLRFESGFSDGPVGFGLDALGLLGIKLDSGGGTSGTGALARNPRSGEAADEYSFLGLTGKARIAQTQLTVGTHSPLMPVLIRNDTRLLPQTFRGAQLQSKDIEGLTLTAGQFRQTRLRDSSDYQDMSMFADGATGGVESDRFDFGGIAYAASPQLTGTYYYARLEDNYRQHYLGLLHTQPLGESLKLRSELRYFDSDDDGRTTVDNRNLGAMFTLSYRGHALAASYQRQTGDTGQPFIAGGADPFVFNTQTYHHFLRADEDSWQARYDYDFAALGIPGLTLMARYVRGSDFEIRQRDAHEWERDVDIAYVIQSGPLRNLSLRWRNVAYRGSRTTDIDENRLIVNYVLKFW